MSIPQQIDAKSPDDYLEVMTQAVFQAGVSWAMVENKWPAFQKEFAKFDTRKVAKFTDKKIDRLAEDASILRSRNKIEATVLNARALLQLEEEYGDVHSYFKSFSDYNALAADLRERFKYMGDLNCYYFLFRVKHPVPKFETWVRTIPGEHPRMLEMVKLARKQKKKA